MKIAIQKTKTGFTNRWISYCQEKKYDFIIVDIYNNSFIESDLKIDIFLWHVSHENHKDNLIAYPLVKTLELKGIKTFPSSNQLWHFDDKLSQALFFKSQKIHHPKTNFFFEKRGALKFLNNTSYPFVAKLRKGSASSNVFLIENKFQATKIIRKSFSKGFPLYNLKNRYLDKIKNTAGIKNKSIEIIKFFYRFFNPPYYSKMMQREKGYILFQEFIKNKNYDTRVVVVGEKAISLQRYTRDSDFRASGSGKTHYPNEKLDFNYIKMAFDISDRLKVNSIGIDFIKSIDNKIYAIEMSFGFPSKNFLDNSSGYWTRNKKFIKSEICAQEWILENLI